MTLFAIKPWQFVGRRMERNAPVGQRCSISPLCDKARLKKAVPAGLHCGVCHDTFGGLSGFEKHRKDGWCLNPAELNMELKEGIWRQPLKPEDKARMGVGWKPRR